MRTNLYDAPSWDPSLDQSELLTLLSLDDMKAISSSKCELFLPAKIELLLPS